MKDKLGIILLNIRKKKIIPLIKGKLLDVGCGTNEIVKEYRRLSNEEAKGVDVYSWPGVDLVVEDTSQLPFSNNSFDTIICVATFNHILNRSQVIAEMSRVLQKNGQLIVTILPPGISRVWHFIRKPWDVDQSERGMKDGEVYGFTGKEMNEMFSKHGFKLQSSSPFMLGINRAYIYKQT